MRGRTLRQPQTLALVTNARPAALKHLNQPHSEKRDTGEVLRPLAGKDRGRVQEAAGGAVDGYSFELKALRVVF